MALPPPSTTYEVGIVAAMDDETEITPAQVSLITAALAPHSGTFALAGDPQVWPTEWEATLVVENMGNPAIALQRAIGLLQGILKAPSVGIPAALWVPVAANVARVEADPELAG